MYRFALALPVCIAGLAVMSLAAAPTAPVAESVGVTINVRNLATIAAPPNAPRPLRDKASVRVRDVISTGARSAVGVRLADETLFSVGANARVEIDAFVYDRTRSASRMSLNFIKGAFRFVSSKATHAYPGQNAITTPIGVIGIRGTVVTGVIGPEALAYYRKANPDVAQTPTDAETATLIILSDAGEGDPASGGIDVIADGKVTALRKAGQALYFPRRGDRPDPPIFLDPQLRGVIERGAEPPGFERNLRPGQGPDARAQGPGNNNGPQPRGGQGPGGQNDGPSPGQPGGMQGSGPGAGPGGMPGGGPGSAQPR